MSPRGFHNATIDVNSPNTLCRRSEAPGISRDASVPGSGGLALSMGKDKCQSPGPENTK